MLLVIDIDGTIADDSERNKRHIAKYGKSWDVSNVSEYMQGCENDGVIWNGIHAINRLIERGYMICFLTARSQEFREQTMQWLEQFFNRMDFSLIMRPYDNKSDIRIFKHEKLVKIKNNTGRNIILIDNEEVIVENKAIQEICLTLKAPECWAVLGAAFAPRW